jgi:hypothetical protein
MKNYAITNGLYTELRNGFTAFAQAGGTGIKKQEKIKLVNNFISRALAYALALNNLHSSYEVKQEYEVNITPNFSISLDNAIVKKKNGDVAYHVENKDYMDVDMAKRFFADSRYLLGVYPNAINIGLSLQPASPKQTLVDAADSLGLSFDTNTFVMSLVDITRNSQKQNWFSEVDEKDMKIAIDELLNSLTQIIQ